MKAFLLPKPSLALVLALSLAGFGCSSVTAGFRIKPEMVEFITPEKTTRQEVLENLGPPLYDLEDGQLVAYFWETTGNHQWGGIYFFNKTIREPNTPKPKEFAFCVAFDTRGRVTRKATIAVTGNDNLKQAVLRWNSETK